MKQRYVILSCIAAACAMAGAFFFYTVWHTADASREGSGDPELASSDRVEWELMRLRDPATGRIPANIRSKELAFAALLPARDMLGSKVPGVLSTDWSFRGPWSVGGRTRALAVDAANPAFLLAGGVSSGMWRSTDGGATWAKTTGNEQLQSVSCIAQDTREGKRHIWYYGTGEIWGNSADINGDGMFKSNDSGKTWQPLASTSTGTPHSWDNKFDYMWQIATDPSNATQDELYAVSALGGVSRSVDGGATWTSVLGGFGNSSALFADVAVTSTGVVYAALSEYTVGSNSAAVRGIYRSVDGVNWTNITPAGWPAKYKRVVIGISPSDENQVYFLAETPDSGFEGKFVLTDETRTEWHSLWKYTYMSGNGTGAGSTWEDRTANLPAFGGRTGDFISQGSYDLVIAVKPDNPNVVFIGGTNVYRSTDGFTTKDNTAWIGGYAPATPKQNFPAYANHHSDQHAIKFVPGSPTVLLSGNDGGIQRTDDMLADSVQWTPLNNGYITTQFYTVAVDKSADKSNVVMAGAQDNGTWLATHTDSRGAWKKPWGADGAYCAVANGRTSYYASAQLGKVYRFLIDDNGDTLTRTRVDPKGATGHLFINPFVLDPNNNDRMYLPAGSLLWRNSDLTQIPMAQYDDATTIGWDSLGAARVPDTISAVAVSTVPANRVYIGTSRGSVYRIDNAHTGNPASVNVTGAAFPKSSYVSCVAIDPRDANKALVVFSNYSVQSLFYTEDGGTSWAPIGGNLEQNASGAGNGPSCRWAAIVPVGGASSVFLVGTSVGLFATSYIDGMATVWLQEGKESIGNAIVDMIDVRLADGLTALATHGAGIFSGYVNAPVTTAPGAPSLVAPADGATGVPVSKLLEWSVPGSALSSVLEVSKQSDFSTLHLLQKGITGMSMTVGDLEAGLVTYYWRVRVVNSGGTSAYSPVWSFTTSVAVPVQLAPEQGATDVLRTPVLTWESVPGAASYRVQIATSIAFSNLVVDESNVVGASFAAPLLDANKRYYWRVLAKGNDGAEGPFSGRWNFTTGTATGVHEASPQPAFSLMPNYPNPFSNQTTLRFSLQRRGRVHLALYDAAGRSLVVLADKDMDAGEHTTPLSGQPLANGVYYCRLTVDGRSQVRQVTVKK